MAISALVGLDCCCSLDGVEGVLDEEGLLPIVCWLLADDETSCCCCA